MAFILLIDDLRTFRVLRAHTRARTSSEALGLMPLLRANPGGRLWLDHDLGLRDGRTDTILPVLDELARAAAEDEPYPVADVVVHTSNPVGAATMMTVLTRWNFPVRRVSAAEHLIEDGAAARPDAWTNPATAVRALRCPDVS